MNEYVPVDAVISVVVAISPNYTTATTVVFCIGLIENLDVFLFNSLNNQKPLGSSFFWLNK